MIKNDRVLTKFDEIQGKIKGLLGLHSKPIYDEKYIKTKARSFNGETYNQRFYYEDGDIQNNASTL